MLEGRETFPIEIVRIVGRAALTGKQILAEDMIMVFQPGPLVEPRMHPWQVIALAKVFHGEFPIGSDLHGDSRVRLSQGELGKILI